MNQRKKMIEDYNNKYGYNFPIYDEEIQNDECLMCNADCDAVIDEMEYREELIKKIGHDRILELAHMVNMLERRWVDHPDVRYNEPLYGIRQIIDYQHIDGKDGIERVEEYLKVKGIKM